MVKMYVLDTNILLQNPESIHGFDDNLVVITGTTLGELDSKKNAPGELGYNAREAIRMLEELRLKGNLLDGVDMEEGGRLIIEPNGISAESLPNGFDITKPDNKIISTCVALSKKYPDMKVQLVSSDLGMRVAASVVLGSEHVESYRNVIVAKDGYTGHIDLPVESTIIDELYSNKRVSAKGLDLPEGIYLHENEFVTLHAGQQSALSVHRRGELELIQSQTIFGNTKPMNAMQTYAMWALMQPADELPLVIMQGAAGTAKTYLSLAAGLENTYVSQSRNKRTRGQYRKMLISRPNSEAGDNGFGYLPGDLEDKMGPLLLPYHDNLESLFRGDAEDEDNMQIRMQIDDLFETGVIEVCALSYIRGRSLRDSYIICDESQNATKQLIKDVVSRCGIGSKVVLAGDPGQVDNPRLDSRSNGLVHAANAFKDSELACLISFNNSNSVRSDLAKAAIELM